MLRETKAVSIRKKRGLNHLFAKIRSGRKVRIRLDKMRVNIIKVGGLKKGVYPLEKRTRDDVIMMTSHLNKRTVFFFPRPLLFI